MIANPYSCEDMISFQSLCCQCFPMELSVEANLAFPLPWAQQTARPIRDSFDFLKLAESKRQPDTALNPNPTPLTQPPNPNTTT